MPSNIKNRFDEFSFSDLIDYLEYNIVTDEEREYISNRAIEIILKEVSDIYDVFLYFCDMVKKGIINADVEELISKKFDEFIKGLENPAGVMTGRFSICLEKLSKYIMITDEQKRIVSDNALEHMRKTETPIYDFFILGPYFTENVAMEVKDVLNERCDQVIEEVCGGKLELYCDAVRELMGREKINPSDVSYLGKGYFSKAYGVGDKVVKVSNDPTCHYRIQRNSKRFLQPLIRLQTKSYKFEVYEKVDTKSKFSLDELYEVYRDVRDEGMIWTDVSAENVGRLIKDNKVYFENLVHISEDDEKKQQLDISVGTGQGFLDENEIETLKPGEIVILDLDYIFPEDSEEVEWVRDVAYKFERRYRMERDNNKDKRCDGFSVDDCLAATEDVTAKQQLEAMNEIYDNNKTSIINRAGIER